MPAMAVDVYVPAGHSSTVGLAVLGLVVVGPFVGCALGFADERAAVGRAVGIAVGSAVVGAFVGLPGSGVGSAVVGAEGDALGSSG